MTNSVELGVCFPNKFQLQTTPGQTYAFFLESNFSKPGTLTSVDFWMHAGLNSCSDMFT